MSTQIIVETKKDSNTPRRRWRLVLPKSSDTGFYRQVGSFNAFFHGKRQFNWRDKRGNWILYLPHWDEEF